MRSVYLAFLFALLVTCAPTYETRATLVRRSDKPSLNLNPPSIHAKLLTNAQRLALDLSLAPPKFHSGRRIAGRAGPSNGASAHSYLSGIEKYADTSPTLGSGSWNYAYLGGTDVSAAGAGLQRGATSFSDAANLSSDWESAIWLVDSGTYTVTAEWVNNDGGVVSPFFVHNAYQGLIVLTGDAEAFSSAFGSSPAVTLTFVEGSKATVSVPAITPTDQ
ncbi:hypothetical protein DAEQUDRAFT_741234 [Daedalea quercina L-15889]|uniref:Uncharacterized protein n=1 Tax=Daedalea quercina L-15889 TaxID=1314783 RepID=A0A165LK29_9APHY|nr:hypothetical protein DAEQUDRAFT_741234 [Daedalea quercina L-15889]